MHLPSLQLLLTLAAGTLLFATAPAAEPLLTPEQAAANRAKSIAAALASKTSLSDLFDTTKITGAQIDERTIKKTIRVDPVASGPDTAKTLAEGLSLAYFSLAEGIPTKLLIAPGTYREAGPVDVEWANDTVRDTLFVIEGRGNVTWTGADIFPASEWKDEGDGLYSHAWPHQFGNAAFRWSRAKNVIGHRREMVFVSGAPLRPRLLETYTVANIGPGTPSDAKPTWTYTGFRDPKTTLQPGEFGVSERDGNGRRIWIKPPVGTRLTADNVEVSVRPQLLQLKGKRNLVLRGLTIAKVANPEAFWSTPIAFTNTAKNPPENILVENCRFVWNSGIGLETNGNRWTLRNVESSFNGRSGITTGDQDNVLWVNTTTNFNLWRSRWGGDIGFGTGGVKAHETTNHLVLGHTSLGNADHGFWYDINCRNIYMQDIVLVANQGTLFWELSQGPFHGRRLLLANDNRMAYFFNVGTARVEDSILTKGLAASAENWGELLVFGGSDRFDGHAQLSQIESVPHRIEFFRTLFVGGELPRTRMIEERDQRDPSLKTYDRYHYQGRDNVFWFPGVETPFTLKIKRLTATTDGSNLESTEGQEDLTFDQWIEGRETNARNLDPGLIAPAAGDFRLRADSPLAADAARYPQFVTPADWLATSEHLRATRWFEPQD